jgi:hypothetical protein
MTWQERAAAIITDEQTYSDHALRGMLKVTHAQDDDALADIYRAELKRRREARKAATIEA